MSKFKVGDLVKIVKPNNVYGKMDYINQIHKIIRNESDKSEASQWWKLDDNSYFRWQEEELELVDNKIKVTNLRIDKKPKIEEIKKEGNKMLESINLIDLYANKHRKSIEKETKEKIEKIKNESSIKKQYDEITQKCKDDLQKLYISQFTDEEIEKVKETLEGLSSYQKELQHKTSICEFGYFINSDFKNDEIKSFENEMINKINELNDLVKTVKAHVGIAKTKEEVEEILTRYGIIDKKGKLVIK